MADNPPARPDRPLAAQLVHFRIAEQEDRLKREPAWLSGSRNAITLTKGPGLSVVLTLLKKGTKLEEHRARGPLTLHLLSGSLRFSAGNRTLEMAPGEVVVLETAAAHQVEALEESAFLLTLVRPS